MEKKSSQLHYVNCTLGKENPNSIPRDVAKMVKFGDIMKVKQPYEIPKTYVIAQGVSDLEMIKLEYVSGFIAAVPVQVTSQLEDPISFYTGTSDYDTHVCPELDPIRHHNMRMELTGYRETTDIIYGPISGVCPAMISFDGVVIELIPDFPNEVFDVNRPESERKHIANNYSKMKEYVESSEKFFFPKIGDTLFLGIFNFGSKISKISDRVVEFDVNNVPQSTLCFQGTVIDVSDNQVIVSCFDGNVTLTQRTIIIGPVDLTGLMSDREIVMYDKME